MKRFTALFLALVMLIPIFSVAATADTAQSSSVKIDGTDYTVSVGDVIHYTYYVNMGDINGGRITEVLGYVYYDPAYVKLTSDLEMDEDDYYPVMPTVNKGDYDVADNGSRLGYAARRPAGKPAGYDFSTEKVLITVDFEVIAAGTSEIVHQVQTLCAGETVIIKNAELKDGAPVPAVRSVVTIDHAEQPTEEPTDAPTEAPTSAPTEEPTSAPTDAPTQAPTSGGSTLEDGYYLMGTITSWKLENVTAAEKFTANASAPGEYKLEYTFADGDEIKVVKVENGEIKTWYNDGGENYKLTDAGNKTGDCTVYFRPDGNSEWSYFYFTVIKKTVEPTTAPTDEPTSAPTDAPTQAPTSGSALEDGYYLMGTITSWKLENVTAAEKFTANASAPGEYTLDYTFADGDEIKVVKVENGEIKTWYNDGGENYKLTDAGNKTGLCTVYFRPEGNSDWSYFYLTVIKKTVEPTTAPTDEPTSAPTDEPTQAPTSGGSTLEDGYYLIGTINDWDVHKLTTAEKFTANASAPGEYTLEYTFRNDDAIKVVKVENGEIKTWYNDGGENYKLTDAGNKTGLCTVYFRPEGNSDWSYFYLTVIKKTVEPTSGPTDEPTSAPTDEPTQAPTSGSALEDGYYLIGTINNWKLENVTAAEKFTANASAPGEYKLEYTFADGDEIKVVKVENGEIKTWYNDGGENYKLTDAGNKTGLCTVYFRPEGNSDWSYFYFTVIKKTVEPTSGPTDEPTSGPTDEPTSAPTDEPTQAPTSSSALEDGYYLMGTITSWKLENVTAAEKFTANASAPGEYKLEYTFADGDEIKVVKVENGEIKTWYNDGGENYKLTDAGNKTGLCTVYFRPEGNSDWSYFYFTVIKKTVEPTTAPTDEPTEAPTSEQPTSGGAELEDGYYLIGTINDWDVHKLTADEKFTANASTPGEYTLEYTFKNNDAIKVVKIENGEIKTWYNDGGENYKLTDEGNKTGDCTVYFRPEGNSEWSYFYLTVQKKAEQPTDEPTEAPTTEQPTSGGTLEDGYYLMGTVTNWKLENVTAAEKFTANASAPGEYKLEYTFADGDEIKVVKVENGEIKTWYNDGGENYKLTDAGNKTGLCTVYFRPEGNSDWSYFYFTVIKKTVEPTTAPTDEPTEAPTSEQPTSGGAELEDGYYLIGTINDWDVNKLTADEKFAENAAAPGEYLLDYTFKDGDAIKVVKVENGEIKTWYNDGGDNYELTDAGNKTGLCTVYFRPDGNSEWSYFYLTVQKKAEQPTDEPTEAPTTEQPTSGGTLEDGYYLMGTITNWKLENVTAAEKFTANASAPGEYTLDYTFADGDEIKVVKVENGEIKTWYNDGGENYKLTDAGNKTGDCTVYFRPDGNSEWSYFYLTVQKKAEQPTETPTSEQPTSGGTLEDGYYLIGTINDWDVNKLTADEKFAENAAAPGEYLLDYTFKDGDAIKVVKVENGEIKTWYNDGGDNYELTDAGNKTGLCTVYFRPDGNSEWSYYYFTVQKKAEQPTDEPTQAPTEEPTSEPTQAPTEEPTSEPTQAPTDAPTEAPTSEPTQAPTDAPTEAPTDEPVTYEMGDVDQDGIITIIDVTYIQLHLAGKKLLNESQAALIDFNGDGNSNLLDATSIQRYLAGLPYLPL